MTEKLWKVTSIELTDDARRFGIENATYAYHIRGEYLPASDKSGTFAWTIPAKDLENTQYDLSGITAPQSAKEGEEKG